jgi:predicted transposase YbfD/YdcC
LHWSLDVLFREDASQVRKDRAPENQRMSITLRE